MFQWRPYIYTHARDPMLDYQIAIFSSLENFKLKKKKEIPSLVTLHVDISRNIKSLNPLSLSLGLLNYLKEKTKKDPSIFFFFLPFKKMTKQLTSISSFPTSYLTKGHCVLRALWIIQIFFRTD